MVFILLIAYILFEENVLGGGSICVGQVMANHKIFIDAKFFTQTIDAQVEGWFLNYSQACLMWPAMKSLK